MDKAVENSVSKIIPDRFKERLIEALESNRGKAAGTSHKLLVVCLPARVFVHIFVVLLLNFHFNFSDEDFGGLFRGQPHCLQQTARRRVLRRRQRNRQ